MSNMNVCAQLCSTSIEDIMLDWADYSELLVNQIETDIFENDDPKQFNAEYVKLCDARMRAKFHLNSIPPDDRWIRKLCRDHFVHAGYKLYRTRRTILGLECNRKEVVDIQLQ